MARPIKWRRVDRPPEVPEFRPTGGKGAGGMNILLVEEYEAIRLKDALGLEQEACAQRMQISRATFQRILSAARAKLADSLVQGKGIRIEGGNWRRGLCSIVCRQCGHRWEATADQLADAQLRIHCPQCNATDASCLSFGRQGQGRGYGRAGAGEGRGGARGRGHGRGGGRGPVTFDDDEHFCRHACWRYDQGPRQRNERSSSASELPGAD